MSDPSSRPSQPHHFMDQYDFDADFRGGTGCRISVDSLRTWKNADGRYSPVSDEVRAEIVKRAVKYALEKQRVKVIVEP